MALKDLLVVVDDSAAGLARMELAARLAVRHDAHLTGLYVVSPISLPAFVEAELPAELRATLRAQAEAGADQCGDQFDAVMRRHGLSDRSEWRAVSGDPTTAVSIHGRYSDLVIIGQPDPRRDRDVAVPSPGDLVFSCGRPLLVVPYIGTFSDVGDRVLVAWNGSREAARAMADARPILSRAKKVSLLSVNPADAADGGLGDMPGADIAKYLSRHNAKVEVAHTTTDALEPGDALLNTVSDEGCDLLVMGAYGRSRLRELVLGGVTRHILKHMTVPVLMTH